MEIAKMSVVPCLFVVAGLLLSSYLDLTLMSASQFVVGVILYTMLYVPLFTKMAMNKEEKELLLMPIISKLGRK